MAAEYAGIFSSWRRLSSCVSSRATRAEIDDPFWCSATLARTNKVCPRTAVVKVSASRLDVLCFITFTSSLSSNPFTHLHVPEIQRPTAPVYAHRRQGRSKHCGEAQQRARPL